MPGWLSEGWVKGTTHGSAYNFDTHVPLLFMGWKIAQGSTSEATTITDIVPTICSLMGLQMPSATGGQPVEEILEEANETDSEDSNEKK
jgi:arylsulfatase A-like enzyme